MSLLKRFFPQIVLICAISGCADLGLPTPSVPFVHKTAVQQGNVVTQEMVAQLRLGMNRKKVRFVMGTPIIKDTFHAARWDYIYTYYEGGGDTERRLVTAVFNDDNKLIALEGNIKAALGRLEVDKHQDTSIQVPDDYDLGLFAKLKESIPFNGDGNHEAAGENGDAGDVLAEGAEKAAEEAEILAVAEAAEDSIDVPEEPLPAKKKGFFTRIVDAIGLGAEDDGDANDDYESRDPKYRDLSNPEDD
jgi:outer membrane protein assembly factor BamE (lipoprotein component of BamABCDE complex)